MKSIYHNYQLAEARGHIKAGTAGRATLATILEAGVVAFHRGYFGDAAYAKAMESARSANHEAGEVAGVLQESLLSDVSRMNRALREAQTTTDFPVILANLRNSVLRGSYNPVESAIFAFAQRRTAPDFKKMNGYRVGAFDRLKLRPEGTDVERTALSMTEDGYRVANYELAVPFTWEAWVNDDLSAFTIGLQNLGIAARRTRALVAYEAIKADLTAQTLASAAGGPTIERVEALVQALAEQTNDDGKPMPRSLSDIIAPAKWRTTIATTLNSELVLGTTAKAPAANPVFRTAEPHEEPMMAEVLGADWIGFDKINPFLEVATLRGFEAGPKTYTKLPDVVEHIEEGSFDNHSVEVKVGDAVGAKIIDDKSVIRVKGS